MGPCGPGGPCSPSVPLCPGRPSLPGSPGMIDNVAALARQVLDLAASVVRYTAVKECEGYKELDREGKHLSLLTLLCIFSKSSLGNC